MKNVKDFQTFLNESNKFTVKPIAKIGDFHVGDEVFQLGEWKHLEKIENGEAVLVDKTGKKSRIKQADLDRNNALIKVDSHPDYTLNTGRKDTYQTIKGVKVDKKYTGKL